MLFIITKYIVIAFLSLLWKVLESMLKSINNKPTCSLIITTYNQEERLCLVLLSVLALQPLPDEVLIADDGSTEKTQDLIQLFQAIFPCPLLHVWQEDKGFRLAQVRNKAISSAKGEYIILIDGDMILESHFIADHLKFAKQRTLLQGSRIMLSEPISKGILFKVPKIISDIYIYIYIRNYSQAKTYLQEFDTNGFPYALIDNSYTVYLPKEAKARRILPLAAFLYKVSKITSRYFDKKEMIRGIRGCNMGFYKADFLRIKGFNENFIGWGREDSDFVARFLFAGGEMRRLRFYGIAYHIYHPENERNMLEKNHKIYLDTIRHKKVQW
ncbi:hypothetical protein CQA66_04510 [Helicobacter aurati]|uniref:Glycosyl transferase n=1 Tax=Helicobacter aurati TaxID=137778 RepID=A0A3D8J500_9HELI|nr:hypothetical protein CQA66_04510 [Helicobacter aurati]